MPTTVTLLIANPEHAGRSWQIELAEDFDKVFNQVYPLQGPSSALEFRSNLLYTTTDGLRISISPSHIAVVEEGASE